MDDNKTFIGLDLSLQDTGVAILSGSEMKTYDIITKPHQFEHSLLRVNAIADKVIEYVKQYNPSMIVVEDYFVGRNPKAVINLCELGTIVRYRILQNSQKFITITPNQLKKYCLGKGCGGKELVLKGVYKKWNLDVNNNNLADAIVLAYVARSIYNKINNVKQDLLKYEEEVIKTVLDLRQVISTI